MQIMSWLGRQYSKLPVKIVVLVAYVAVLGCGIYGTSQMRVDADVNGVWPCRSLLHMIACTLGQLNHCWSVILFSVYTTVRSLLHS